MRWTGADVSQFCIVTDTVRNTKITADSQRKQLDFLSRHTTLVVLHSANGRAQVAVAPMPSRTLTVATGGGGGGVARRPRSGPAEVAEVVVVRPDRRPEGGLGVVADVRLALQLRGARV